jgi:SP family myo-inositol transporter-like MFS transporter 13
MSLTKKEEEPRLEEVTNDPLPSMESGKATFFVYVLVFCVCVGGFLFGYDTGGKVANMDSRQGS